MSDLLLQFLQKLMSAGDVLHGLGWVLLGFGYAWRWHGLRPLYYLILYRHVWSGHSCPLPLMLLLRGGIMTNTSTKDKIKTKTNTKSGGQECPPYTLFASPRGWALRLFFKDRELNLLLNWINSIH